MSSERLVVAIDTSTDMLACAVARVTDAAGDERMTIDVLATGDHMCRRRANVELVNTIDAALADAGRSRDEVDAYLVGRGPGSFTGVRIGISTAKGLARGANVPLYGASTLDACAWTAWRAGVRGLLGVAADAMRGEVYPALYQLDEAGAHRMFDRERVVKAAVAVEEWAARPDAASLQLTGDGLKRYGSRLNEAGLTNRIDESLWHPTGEGLLLAWRAVEMGAVAGAGAVAAVDAVAGNGAVAAMGPAALHGARTSCDPALVLPIYTRLSDAEENERKRLGLVQSAQSEVTGVADELAGRHLQFRPMGAADAEAASALEASCFAGAAHTPWTPTQFLSELGEGATVPRSWWVAHDNGELVGLAGGMVIEHDVQILDVAVAPERRRAGIARKLLAHVSYDAQMLGCTTASLEVEDGNAPAMALYEHLGFKQIGRRRNYYGQGADALVMQAELPLALPVDAASPEPTSAVMRVWPLAPVNRTEDERTEIERRKLVLAIESSCDETAVAIIDAEGSMLANQVSTQIDFHARFGGVVPEIASRKHVEVIVGVVDAALEEASQALGLTGGTLEPKELAAVGVTQGPGLVGALVVGVAFAKGFAYSAGVPLIAVNHLEGHLFANLLAQPDLKPPFIFTLVSGGHTMLVHVRDWGDYRVLGETLDDAVGEAFDKVAKALGLGYPGGPIISRLAETGDPKAIDFPRALNRKGDYRFSLSGLKTAVVNYIEQETAAGRTIHLPDLAASFEAAVFDVQYKKAWNALHETGAREYCIGGGVAANPHLRQMMVKKLGRQGVRVTLPPRDACTDNAAMIAEVARRKFERGEFSGFDIDADPNMTL
ncbi:tRNA (adenosine(37)-N6)-threonylcarbamoyltransferase complex transferase subunit TsaD [Enorma massiliensis]|uniref:tRNA (adenosine(37)-N6)-threonylcarbamoyltransferase complex transferase subunit TsaD n=1 Tax=Enorma massiliensis TaxID=1472761 RepID=UPI003AB13761